MLVLAEANSKTLLANVQKSETLQYGKIDHVTP